MNSTQLECFLAVANHLNFSRAAEQLQLTQPAVSHQISSLEDELGSRLFHRTSKSVRLTQEGFLFTQYANEILKLSRMSMARMKEYRERGATRLGIGCRNTIELRFLRGPLEKLRRETEDLRPVLRVNPFDSLENLLEEGDIQIMTAFRETAPRKMRYRELLRCSVALVCSPEHPLAAEEKISLDRLREVGKLAVCRPPACPPSLFALQSRIVADKVTEDLLFCEQVETAGLLAETGYAVTLLPDFPTARYQGVRYIPLEDAGYLSFGVVTNPEERRDAALSRFLNLLEESARRPEREGA